MRVVERTEESLAERAALELELKEVQAQIDEAYWRFTRMSKALPPSLAEPQAYRRREEIKERLRVLPKPLPPAPVEAPPAPPKVFIPAKPNVRKAKDGRLSPCPVCGCWTATGSLIAHVASDRCTSKVTRDGIELTQEQRSLLTRVAQTKAEVTRASNRVRRPTKETSE